jgi:hydrogenase expression/formation protein HypD
MDYFSEFRRKETVQAQSRQIHQVLGDRSIALMEVCGGHTASFFRFGLKDLLPQGIKLLSGPGCPVCVTPKITIDQAVEAALRPDVIVATFGDLLRVPGSRSSLEEARSRGGHVEIIYGADQALDLAKKNPDKTILLIGIGFETTAPTSAATVLAAQKQNLENFTLLSAHKTMPEPMAWLVTAGEVAIDGFICPGHVSAIIGAKPYEFLAKEHGIACAIAGFEPADLLQAILSLVRQIVQEKPFVDISYSRTVRWEGNKKAQRILDQVFEKCPSDWRGLGQLPGSGLKLREEFKNFDALSRLELDKIKPDESSLEVDKGCLCGEVLRGVVAPDECPLFGEVCTPEDPVGACMVSVEGACRNYYTFQVNS